MKSVSVHLRNFIEGEDVDVPKFEGTTLEAWSGAAKKTATYLKEVAIEEMYRQLLKELAPPLEKAGVHPIVLGGISLWEDYYPLVGSRKVNDLDVWIPPEEEEACHKVLNERGFRQHSQYQACWMRGALEIDMHIHPINSERAFAFDQLYHFDARLCYEEGDELPACPDSVWRRPAAEELWLHHALHAIKHEFERINLAVDLHYLLSRHIPTSDLGKRLWTLCDYCLQRIDCGTPRSPDKVPRLARNILKERPKRPFLAGLRLLASCGESPLKFWWALIRGNPAVYRESGGVIKRFSRISKRL